jgi:hypothetical protein
MATEQSTKGTLGDQVVEFSYRDGVLSWRANDKAASGSFKKESILTVVGDPHENDVYSILSLIPTTSSDDAAPHAIFAKSQASRLPPLFLSDYFLTELPKHLRIFAEDMHVVISTRSGTGRAEAGFEALLEPTLEGLGFGNGSYHVTRTQSHESVRHFARNVLRKKAMDGVSQTVFLLSGDGGMVDIINGLLGEGARTRYVFTPRRTATCF